MSDEFIIRHSSPTLAGLKTGNLFNCPYKDREELLLSLRSLNRRLVPKGVRVIPLKLFDNKVLLYIYRPRFLERDLAKQKTAELLMEYGYSVDKPDKCIVQLSRKICGVDTFPHEIGLFLGYPLEDVCGFVDHPKEGCKCTGYWKVYGDEKKAKKQFAAYRKCTSMYCAQAAKGRSIEQLTVATFCTFFKSNNCNL